MKVKFKKLHEGAKLPKKATAGSAAYDLVTPEDTILKQGRAIIPLGFAMEMEQGYEALIDARSGFSSKGMEGYKVSWVSASGQDPVVCKVAERFDCDVIEGKIDSDYRNGVGVIVINRGCDFLVKAGTRIAQMTFHKVEDVDWEMAEELSETDRKGGFGHSGTRV